MKVLFGIVTLAATASIVINTAFINNARKMSDALTNCAEQENVFKCKWIAVPVTQPKIVYRDPMILPPPVRG